MVPWLGPATTTALRLSPSGSVSLPSTPGAGEASAAAAGARLGTVVFNTTATVLVVGWAVVRSGLPSALKSATATEAGRVPVGTLVGLPKLPPGPPSSTVTRCQLRLATARSGSPSRLKSPTATEDGPARTWDPDNTAVGPAKPPPGPPSSTRTWPDSSATARSGSPSWLNSPTATETGSTPVPTVVGPVKVAPELPRSTSTRPVS